MGLWLGFLRTGLGQGQSGLWEMALVPVLSDGQAPPPLHSESFELLWVTESPAAQQAEVSNSRSSEEVTVRNGPGGGEWDWTVLGGEVAGAGNLPRSLSL